MYILERLNVVKIAATEHERDKLLAQGFKEIKSQEKKRDEKKAAK